MGGAGQLDQSGPRDSVVAKGLPWAFVVAALAAAAFAMASQKSELGDAWAGFGMLDLVGSLVLAVLGVLATFFMWRCLLTGLGVHTTLGSASRMFFVTQLGKYLPGAIWPVLAQVEYGKRVGLDRKAVVAANLLALSVGLGAGLMVSVIALGLPREDGAWILLLALPVLAALLHPRPVMATLNFVLRRLGRTPLQQKVGWRTMLTAAALAVVAWLLFGAHLLVLVSAAQDGGGSVTASAIGAYALAACAGMVVVPAPAGVGVRDAVLVLALGTTVGSGAALAAGLASRVVVTIADVGLALAVLASRSARAGIARARSGRN